MKIEQIESTIVEMPYKKPLITATNKFVVARGLLVKVIAAGIEGYGYADLFPRTGETPEAARHIIDGVLKPRILDRDLEELVGIRAAMDQQLAGNHRAKAALECALYDALARNVRVPLYVLFGGRYRGEIKIVKMVSVDEPEVMAEESTKLVREGFALKLKMSGEIKPDLARVAAVRAAVGSEVFIKVDANEAYDAHTAIRVAKGLANCGVEIFEQPVPRAQFDSLGEVKKRSPIKIEADQSVRTVEDAYRLIKDGKIDGINTGVQKAGGIHEVRRIAELCALAGIRCSLSNTAGSMVGDAAAVHVAVSSAGISSLCELGEFETVSGDPFTGLKVSGGTLRPAQGDGVGVRLRSA